MSNPTILVQVKMQDNTLEQVDRLQARVHAPSRSDAIRRAVELSDIVTGAAENGFRIIIEKDGKRTQLLIPGLKEQRF